MQLLATRAISRPFRRASSDSIRRPRLGSRADIMGRRHGEYHPRWIRARGANSMGPVPSIESSRFFSHTSTMDARRGNTGFDDYDRLARDRGPRPTKGHTLQNFDRKNPRRSDKIIIIGMTPSSVPSVDATCIIQLDRSDKRLPYRWSRREAEEDESPEKVGQGRGDRRASTTQTKTKVGHQASRTI